MNKENDRKPIYTVDVIPTLKTVGITSLIFFFITFIIVFLIMIVFDFWLGLLCEVLFIMGGFVGRDFEHRHHKQVLSHMTPGFQKVYKDIDYSLAKADVEEAKKKPKDDTN